MSEEDRSGFISKFIRCISKGGSESRIRGYEEAIIEDLEDYLKEENFYDLPTTEIVKIIRESQITDEDLLDEIFQKTKEAKGEESILLLNLIDPEEMGLHECVKIISMFGVCPIFKRLDDTYQESMSLPEVDYEEKYKKVKEENERLKLLLEEEDEEEEEEEEKEEEEEEDCEEEERVRERETRVNPPIKIFLQKKTQPMPPLPNHEGREAEPRRNRFGFNNERFIRYATEEENEEEYQEKEEEEERAPKPQGFYIPPFKLHKRTQPPPPPPRRPKYIFGE